ncbi:hypothetical protein JRQ81_003855, partial [Phrynocephalus forsythii]
MAGNKERGCSGGAPLAHVNGFPPAVYPFPFPNPHFEMLTNGGYFRTYPTDLPKEMASLCEFGKRRRIG